MLRKDEHAAPSAFVNMPTRANRSLDSLVQAQIRHFADDKVGVQVT